MMSKMQMQSVKVEEARTAVLNFPAGGGAAITVKGVVRRGRSPLESRVFFVKTDAANAVRTWRRRRPGPTAASRSASAARVSTARRSCRSTPGRATSARA